MKTTAIVITLLWPAVAAAYTVNTTSAGAEVHWTVGQVLYWSEGEPSAIGILDELVYEGLRAWQTAGAMKELTFDAAWAEEQEPEAARTIRVVLSDDWDDDDPRLARTVMAVQSATGRLVHVTILLDAATCYRELGCDDTVAHDLRTVIGHELGHALGLSHSGDEAALMSPFLVAGQERAIGSDDTHGAAHLYQLALADGPDVGGADEQLTSPMALGCAATGRRGGSAWAWLVMGLLVTRLCSRRRHT